MIMVTRISEYSMAKLLINKYGSDAEKVAEQEMLVLIALDDVKNASVWMSVMCAINDLGQVS